MKIKGSGFCNTVGVFLATWCVIKKNDYDSIDKSVYHWGLLLICNCPFPPEDTWRWRGWLTPSPGICSKGSLRLFAVVHFVTESCLTFFATPMDHCLPLSSVRDISQARILEWVAISSFREEIEPASPALQADSLPWNHQGSPLRPLLAHG